MNRNPMPVLVLVGLLLAGTVSAQSCFTPLMPGVPATMPSNCSAFGGTGSLAGMNAIGVASTSNWGVFVSGSQTQGVSDVAGNATDFLVLQLPFGTSFSGTAGHAATAAPGVIEQVVAASVHQTNTTNAATLQAGHVLKLHHFAVLANGSYRVTVTGDPSLKWFLFDRTHLLTWRSRASAIASGQAGVTSGLISLTAQPHALVITRDGGVPTLDLPYTARLGTLLPPWNSTLQLPSVSLTPSR